MRGSKKFGSQSCDACSREFVAESGNWTCNHCGYDNRQGKERLMKAGIAGSEKSKEMKELKKK